MPIHRGRNRAGVRGLLAVGIALVPLTAAGAAAAQSEPAPQLSIGIDDGRSSAEVGDELTYAITVHNLGDAPVEGLVVTQTLPTGLAFGSADASGVEEGGTVRWVVDLPAGEEAVVRSTMTVTETPDELLRLASVACAGLASAPPLVCATDSDELPAGARRAADEASASDDDDSSSTPVWLLGGGIGAVAVALLVLVLRRRRNRRHRSRARAGLG